MVFIPESDLYRLIIRSRLPAAERFEAWVFEEVLPSIRQTGNYAPNIGEIVRREVRAALGEMLGPGVEGVRPRPRERACGKLTGIIANLDAPLRQEIDLMLEGRKLTYTEISAELLRDYGVRVSKSSIARYAKQLHKQKEALEQPVEALSYPQIVEIDPPRAICMGPMPTWEELEALRMKK